jgi:hypothetical protein
MVEDVIDTAINALDDLELETFRGRVVAIPTGSISTLNFSLSEADKQFLFRSGYDTAKQFFEQGPDPTNRFGKTPTSWPPMTSAP